MSNTSFFISNDKISENTKSPEIDNSYNWPMEARNYSTSKEDKFYKNSADCNTSKAKKIESQSQLIRVIS